MELKLRRGASVFLLLLCTALAYSAIRSRETIKELQEDVVDIQRLRNKVETYEYAEWDWQNYKAMLQSGRAFYDNGRLITAAHYK